MAAQERYSEWGFVDTELLQRDHGSQRDRESGQRATIPTRQAPPLLQQRDRALDRRAGLTVRPVVDLRKRWQLAIGRLAQRRVDPAAKKPRSPSTSRPARIRSNPASQNDRASCIAPRVDSLASSSRPHRSATTSVFTPARCRLPLWSPSPCRPSPARLPVGHRVPSTSSRSACSTSVTPGMPSAAAAPTTAASERTTRETVGWLTLKNAPAAPGRGCGARRPPSS